jgi:V/A-type H+-transporting ATPase subunit A
VSQATLRVAGTLWALDAELAHQRQFPAVDWATSYSLHADLTTPWFASTVDGRWAAVRARTLELLQRDRELREIAGLIGPEALQDADRLVLAVAQLLREVVLGQSAYHPHDARSSPEKTFQLASLACGAADRVSARIQAGTALSDLDLGPLRRALVALRDAAPEELTARVAEATGALERLSASEARP